MKKKFKIIAVSVLAAAAVVSAALAIRYLRERSKENDPYTPAPGEYYNPNQLPEWDENK